MRARNGMQKAVLDTNILVSAMFSTSSKPAAVLDMVLDGEIQACHSPEILLEYDDVLYRPKFNFPVGKIQSILSIIIEAGIEVIPAASVFPMADESDRKFYDLHKAAGAILITGNIRHYPKEDSIMKPADFLSKFF